MSFHKTAILIFLIFNGVMGFAVYKAFSKRSGSAGMDVGEIHLIRQREKT